MFGNLLHTLSTPNDCSASVLSPFLRWLVLIRCVPFLIKKPLKPLLDEHFSIVLFLFGFAGCYGRAADSSRVTAPVNPSSYQQGYAAPAGMVVWWHGGNLSNHFHRNILLIRLPGFECCSRCWIQQAALTAEVDMLPVMGLSRMI
jgi:hypothetical protein